MSIRTSKNNHSLGLNWLPALLLVCGLGGGLALPSTALAQGTPEAPLITVGKVSNDVLEGSDAQFIFTANFPVTGSGATNDLGVLIEVTVEGTTVIPADYTTPGSINIPNGSTRYTLAIPTNDDTDLEAVGSRIVVKLLEDPEDIDRWTVGDDVDIAVITCNAAPARATCVNYIDNEPIVNSASARANEGEDLVWAVTFNRAASPARDILINYTTSEAGTSTSATQDVDYTHTTGVLTFTTGETRKEVRVKALDDLIDESDEQLFLNLSSTTFDHTIAGGATANGGTIVDQGLPVVSAGTVGPVRRGENVVFPVRLQRPTTFTLVVNYATADGTATAGSDYTATNGTLTFGGDSGVMEAQVVVSSNASAAGAVERQETFSLNLSLDPQSEQYGETSNGTGILRGDGLSDEQIKEINEAILPHVAATIAQETSDAVAERVKAAFTGNGGGLSLSGLAAGYGDFAIPLGGVSEFADGGSGGMNTYGTTLWGRVYQADLDVEGNVIFEGDVTGAMVGVDTLFSNFLLGVGFNSVKADMDWDYSDFLGTHETTLAGVHPYFGWSLDGGVYLWGSVGYERGDIQLVEGGGSSRDFKRDAALRTAAFGGYGPLHETSGAGGTTRFGFVADGVYAHLEETETDTVQVESGWVRAGFELDYDRDLEGGNALSTTLELTLRHDFGDARTGTGVELSGGIDYGLADTGLLFDLNVRSLLSHDEDVNEWGISGGVAYVADQGGRGLSLSFRPEWGVTESAAGQLWDGGYSRYDSSVYGVAGSNYGSGYGAYSAYSQQQPGMFYSYEVRYGIPTLQGQELLTLLAEGSTRQSLWRDNSGRVSLQFRKTF